MSQPSRRLRTRRAFTLIEVMACVLVLGLGLLAATALIFYGLRLARGAQGKSLGMATAMTVLSDPKPLATDPTLSPSANAKKTSDDTSGYLNGLWVVRKETDAVALDGATGKRFAVTVTVDVYEADGGAPCASANRRIIKRLP